MAGLKEMSKPKRALKSLGRIADPNPKTAWNPMRVIDRTVDDVDTLYNGKPPPPPGPVLEMPDTEAVDRDARRKRIRKTGRQSTILSDSLG